MGLMTPLSQIKSDIVEPSNLVEEFPAPEFRGNQRQALADIRQAYDRGNDIVLVQAPTGSGKSLLARAILGCAKRDSTDCEATGGIYTTPQVSQLEEVAEDEFLDDIQVLSGKSNYGCILPSEKGVPVPRAKCNRDPDFECHKKQECPYFRERRKARSAMFAGMTLAYYLQTAFNDMFIDRDVVVIDEAHGLPEWAEMYAAIEISPQTVPNWSEVRPTTTITDVDTAAAYIAELIPILRGWKNRLLDEDELDEEKTIIRDQLDRLVPDIKWFLDTVDDSDGLTWVVDPDERTNALTLKPLRPERFLSSALWERGKKFALLSATLLNKAAFCSRVGIPKSRVELVEVEHTFPLENRPLVDVTQGKMTYDERDETIPNIADVIERLCSEHAGEKGFIHCHSYSIQDRLLSHLNDGQHGHRVMGHDSENRDERLKAWLNRNDDTVFFSVKMEEALNLEDDLCRWQVLCKAPYQNTTDPSVEYQLEEKDRWGWYYRSALRTIIQACGRIVRSKRDWGTTYIADSSILDVFSQTRSDMPPWFEEQVDAMQRLSPAVNQK